MKRTIRAGFVTKTIKVLTFIQNDEKVEPVVNAKIFNYNGSYYFSHKSLANILLYSDTGVYRALKVMEGLTDDLFYFDLKEDQEYGIPLNKVNILLDSLLMPKYKPSTRPCMGHESITLYKKNIIATAKSIILNISLFMSNMIDEAAITKHINVNYSLYVAAISEHIPKTKPIHNLPNDLPLEQVRTDATISEEIVSKDLKENFPSYSYPHFSTAEKTNILLNRLINKTAQTNENTNNLIQAVTVLSNIVTTILKEIQIPSPTIQPTSSNVRLKDASEIISEEDIK